MAEEKAARGMAEEEAARGMAEEEAARGMEEEEPARGMAGVLPGTVVVQGMEAWAIHEMALSFFTKGPPNQTANYRIQELEEQVKASEVKYGNAEAGTKQHAHKISELMAELEAFQAKASTLYVALQASVVKEQELSSNLVLHEEEKKKLEDTPKSSERMLPESENLTEIMKI